MKLDELMQKYGCLLDEEGKYYLLDKDGKKKEAWAPVIILTELFDISKTAVKTRISALISLKLKDRNGNIVDFYNINEAKTVCADLLAELPQCDEKGIAIIDGRKFAPIHILTKLFGFSAHTIKARLGKLTPRPAKIPYGRIVNVYEIKQAKACCADLLAALPQCDKKGIANADGCEFATKRGLAKALGIATPTIKVRIKDLAPKKAKDFGGHLIDVYEISKVKAACADLLADLPQSDERGIVTIDGLEFAPILVIATLFGISEPTVKNRSKGLKPRKAKDRMGRLVDVYEVNKIKSVCSDLLAKKQSAKT